MNKNINNSDDKNNSNKKSGTKNGGTFKGFLIYVSIPLILMMIISAILNLNISNLMKDQRYSEIVSKFKKHEVTGYDMDLGSGKTEIKLKNGEIINYTVPNVGLFYEDIKGYIKEYNEQNPDAPMDYDFTKPYDFSLLSGIMVNAIFPLLTIGFMIWIFRRKSGIMGSKDSGFGKAKMKKENKDNKTLFTDVAGADEEKQELTEIVDFLKNPKKYQEIGARIPKGVLLIGPPGTGKTLLARAVAGEAYVPFFSISGSEFEEMFVGVGASRVKDLFDQAKKSSPAIIFIDEIDAVGRRRGNGITTSHDGQSLNQMLVEMDGFEKEQNVVVIAATNRVDVLDPALLRPGRFDRRIVMSLPDVKGREEILKVHARNKKFANDVDFSLIAKTTAGFTGADLENLLNEAALLAARLNLSKITISEIEEAQRKVTIGSEKRSKIITEKDKKITAYHEAGHAIVTCFCENVDKVHEVSIIPRGLAGGYTMHLPEIDEIHLTKKKMLEEINVYMGGRVAETLIFGEDSITTGASHDIEQATKIAKKMVTKYGMSSEIGPISYFNDDEDIFFGRYMNNTKNYSEIMASKIDSEIKKMLTNCYETAKKILESNMEKLHDVSGALLENEKLNSEEFYKIMET